MKRLALLVLAAAMCLAALAPATADASFGIVPESFVSGTFEADGSGPLNEGASPDEIAASHPFEQRTVFSINTDSNGFPEGFLKEAVVDAPPGLAGNPNATPRCPRSVFFAVGKCPNDTVVGVARGVVDANDEVVAPFTAPVFNLEPGGERPAAFGFVPVIVPAFPVLLEFSVRSSGDYGLTATIPGISQGASVVSSDVSLWGVPASPLHDDVRGIRCNGDCGPGTSDEPGPSDLTEEIPMIANPAHCDGNPLLTKLSVVSWEEPKNTHTAIAESPPVEECEKLVFTPAIEARPTTNVADAPSGLDFHLNIPQNEDPAGLATPPLRKAVVTLPEGFVINPASADGRQACTPAEIGQTTAPGATPVHFNEQPGNCPDASKLGSVRVASPALPEGEGGEPGELSGAIYLGGPESGSITGPPFTLYMDVSGHGVEVKLQGSAEPDPQTGRLTTTFEETPQLPFEDMYLRLFGGARAPLRTPATCGTYETTSSLTPWSAPQSGPPAEPTDSFEVLSGAGGGSCPRSATEEPHSPSFDAGTLSPKAGAYTPFVMHLARADGSQELKGIDVSLPPGLSGKLAGLSYCSEAQIAAASQRSGRSEQAQPSCPQTSEVGTVNVAAGAGPNPFWVQGHAYLAGPYEGAPLSLAVITPAVAGPFDLGTVVVRAALYVNPETAQITVKSDPIPTILAGIPLDVRSIAVNMDRPSFTLNPTSCDPMAVTGNALSVLNQSAPLSDRFQVGECANLPFAPKIAMGFTNRSQVHKRKKPGLDFRLSQKSGEANIKSVTVKLPRSVVLDVNGASGALCEVAQAENGTCPASSIVGTATAATPLLDQPLSGAVYFVRGDNALPNIMVALRGQISINLHSKSRVDKMGRLISTFGTVPDAPISQFHLTLGSAGHGVLSVAPDSDLCTGRNSKGRVSIAIVGQNGKSHWLAFKMRTPCKKARKHKR